VQDWIGVLLLDNGYCTNENLTAPGPDRLIATGNSRDLPRLGEDLGLLPSDADARTRMTHRLASIDGATLYKRRAATVEPVNGHLKDRTGLRRFSRRGLAACQAELEFAALVLNLRKVLSLAPRRASRCPDRLSRRAEARGAPLSPTPATGHLHARNHGPQHADDWISTLRKRNSLRGRRRGPSGGSSLHLLRETGGCPAQDLPLEFPFLLCLAQSAVLRAQPGRSRI
jgi:hypothetical protein